MPRFLELSSGRVFTVEFAPLEADPSREPIVVIPPFGEEMNRSRRMLACQGNALAAAGHRVILFDFVGTGDSDGEFAASDLTTWQRNTTEVIDWATVGDERRFSIIAVRFGALLLPQIGAEWLARAVVAVLWQPVTDGKTYLRQFLRLRVAANMGTDLEGVETTASLLGQLEGGQAVEIGGYELSGSLASAISSRSFDFSDEQDVPPVFWFDIAVGNAADVSPATARRVGLLADKGIDITASAIPDESFWSTVETTTAPKLLDATNAVFAGRGH